jgi:SAM-dependent methyltransferase
VATDVFQRVDELDQATIGRIVERLEHRGSDPTFVAMRDQYLDALDLAAAGRVIEIGCGTGVVARAIAVRPEFSGVLHATDLTQAFIDAAVGLAATEGVDDRIHFAVGDSNQIEPVEGGYDVIIAHTLITHVADPEGLIAEAARALRPGGRLAVFDGDYASIVPGTSSDPELDRAVMDAATAATVACANPYLLRILPRLLAEHGLQLSIVQDHLYSEVGHSNFFLDLAEYIGPLIAASGAVDGHEIDRWLGELRRANDNGVYFGFCNYYTYIATKPADG